MRFYLDAALIIGGLSLAWGLAVWLDLRQRARNHDTACTCNTLPEDIAP